MSLRRGGSKGKKRRGRGEAPYRDEIFGRSLVHPSEFVGLPREGMNRPSFNTHSSRKIVWFLLSLSLPPCFYSICAPEDYTRLKDSFDNSRAFNVRCARFRPVSCAILHLSCSRLVRDMCNNSSGGKSIISTSHGALYRRDYGRTQSDAGRHRCRRRREKSHSPGATTTFFLLFSREARSLKSSEWFAVPQNKPAHIRNGKRAEETQFANK